MENVLIAAEASKYGATPVTSFPKDSVALLLGLPRSWTAEAMVTIGRRRNRHFEPRRNPLAARVHWQRYGGGEVMTNRTPKEHQSASMLELAAFLSSSAEMLPDEPADYGQFRLLEGTLRALRSMSEREPHDSELADRCAELERTIVTTLGDPEKSRAVAAGLSQFLARRLANRIGSADSG
jgi:hypothetical protein